MKKSIRTYGDKEMTKNIMKRILINKDNIIILNDYFNDNIEYQMSDSRHKEKMAKDFVLKEASENSNIVCLGIEYKNNDSGLKFTSLSFYYKNGYRLTSFKMYVRDKSKIDTTIGPFDIKLDYGRIMLGNDMFAYTNSLVSKEEVEKIIKKVVEQI